MKRMTILTVDDRPDNLYTLQQLISEHLSDCELVTASCAKDGLIRAGENEIDCALIDVQMPDMDGIEMCRVLKSQPLTAHLPIILITAHGASSQLKASGLEVGADDFLTKPINNVELVAKIKVMLRIKSTEDEMRNINAHLEEKVSQRTRELQEHRDNLRRAVDDRTAELRKLVHAMAGREVRMGGLKKTIRALRTQLEEAGLTPVADDPAKGDD